MWLFLFSSCSNPPCTDPLKGSASLVDLFRRLENDKCFHPRDVDTLDFRINEYHRKTTVHCDQVYRRSSIDGLTFDGPEELVLKHASVADVYIDDLGRHVLVYNDADPDRLLSTARTHPQHFWERGLIGFGGLGLSIDPMNSSEVQHLQPNLHLDHPLELVDPDIGKTTDGQWRISFFAVQPTQMDTVQFGPMAAAKPHNFFRTVGPTLEDFPTPKVVVASSEGSTGGADPAILSRKDGSEILYVGPLDHTTVGWVSSNGTDWPTTAPPDFNSNMRFATPDAISDPNGGYRLYGMTNGKPGEFQVSHSEDGIQFNKPQIVLRQKGAFNISVGIDPVGVWWAYYNMTDPVCMKSYGSKKVNPF